MNRAAAFVSFLLLAACKKDTPESLAKPLESADPAVREQTAKKLQAMYRADPKSLGDLGEDYWKNVLTLGKTDPVVRRHIGAFERLPLGENREDRARTGVRLDAYWIAELRLDKSGNYEDYNKLERSVKSARPTPPPSFNGTWKTYFINGAVDSEVVYLPANRQESREYYDDGTLREEKVYTRDTLIPIGKLVHYYPSAKKAYEQPYTNGKMNGVQRSWYPSGALEHEWPQVDGKREGKWKYFRESGELDLCEEYKADVEVSRGCK